jgi:hypothetical protein
MTTVHVTEHNCRKCGCGLTTSEITATKDRCVNCYAKAVRFVMMKLKKENETAVADLKTLKVRFDELMQEQKDLIAVMNEMKKVA